MERGVEKRCLLAGPYHELRYLLQSWRRLDASACRRIVALHNARRECGHWASVWLVTAANVSVRSLMRALEDDSSPADECLPRQTGCVSSSRNCLPVSSRPRAFPLHHARCLPRPPVCIVIVFATCCSESPSFSSRCPPPASRALRQITSSRPPPTDNRQANLNITSQPGLLVAPPKPDAAAQPPPLFSSHSFIQETSGQELPRCLARRGSTSSLSS